MDKMRDEFEAWCKDKKICIDRYCSAESEQYTFGATQARWECWQAARQSAGQERGEAVALPVTTQQLKDTLRATGWLTHEQAWDCAEAIEKLLAAHPPADAQSRIAELEAQLAEANALHRNAAETLDVVLETRRSVERELTESREREGMVAVPCDEATAASFWLTTCASNIEAGFSQWERDEMRRIAALLAADKSNGE